MILSRRLVPLLLLAMPLGAQTGTVQGRVRAAESAAPLAGARVTLVGSGCSAITDREGRYRFYEVLGTETMRAELAGRRPMEIRDFRVAAGQEVTLDVPLAVLSDGAVPPPAKGATLTGTVRSTTGERLIGAHVVLVDHGISAQVDTAGVYRFDGVGPGEYALRVSRPGFRPYRIEGIRVAPEQRVVQDLMLQAAPMLGGCAAVSPAADSARPPVLRGGSSGR